MYYIRFLKPPKLFLDNGSKSLSIRTLVTIATDLGDRFFPGRITLSAGLFPPDGRCMVSSNRFVWEQGMRCLWIEIRLHKIQHLEWPMQMNVSHMAGGIVHNALSLDSVPWIVDACSHFVHSDVKADISKQIVRAFTLSPGRLLYMHEDTGDSMSRHIWDAGVALAACLSTAAQQPLHPKCPASLTKILHSTPNQVLRTLELGSGCGIPGKTLASLRRNCLVWLTDIPEAMELLDDNIRISKTAPGSSLSSQVLIWGQELPTDIRQEKFDLVLVSDCTYNTDSIPALVKTLSDLVFQSPSILIVVATKVRHPSERVFFDLMANAGMKEFELVTVALRTGSFEADDDDDQNEYVDIHIFPGSEVSSQASDELGETAGERFIEI